MIGDVQLYEYNYKDVRIKGTDFVGLVVDYSHDPNMVTVRFSDNSEVAYPVESVELIVHIKIEDFVNKCIALPAEKQKEIWENVLLSYYNTVENEFNTGDDTLESIFALLEG